MVERNGRIRRLRFYTLILIAILIISGIFAFKSIRKNKGINETTSIGDLSKEEASIGDLSKEEASIGDLSKEEASIGDLSKEEASIGDLSKEEVDDRTHVVTPKIEDKDLEDIQSIIEYGSNILVGSHYPIYDKDNIDSISENFVTQYIADFKKELANDPYYNKDSDYELNIDFETYNAPNNLVSVIFNITEDSSTLAHPDTKIFTKVYDLSNDIEVELANIMDGEYLEHISQISENYFRTNESYKDNVDSSIFKEGINPSAENYANFILKEDKIVFIFARYQLFSGNFGMPSVEIPYSDLKDYIKPEWVELFTKEEDFNQIDKTPEKPKVDITLPKRDIDPNKPMIALTFDDGPNKKTTTPILDILKEYDSVATFFILGNRVSNNEELLKRMLEEGNEIGNHSYNHKELTKLSSEELREQIIDTQDAIIESTGFEPKLVRPTYGSYNDKLKSEIDMPLILWSIDTLDWKSRDANKVADYVLANVKDGDIILMHDIHDSTAEATQILVPKLIDMGFQLVTVSELYESKGESLESGKIYH